MTAEQGIRVNNLSYSVAGRQILEDVSLFVEKGVNRTILGASGAGKTTILKLMLCLLSPDTGEILIDGVPLAGLSEGELIRLRRKIAIVFQGGALFDSMTVGENVGYRLFQDGELSEAEIERIVLEKLSFVGLAETIDYYPSQLSGGMKKRVAISRALASEPDYIFFDEPTTGLDPVGVYNICNLMRRLQQEGKTTLMVTHDLVTAFAVSECFSFIHDARLIFDGPKEEMMRSGLPAIREFLEPTDASLFVLNETPAGGDSHEAK
ncbi:MAG TPA: ATP-binding cassette domain-containing protein [Geobacteraceae bacterium]|nr:ATP-binding cassette domain-containing protein [Geobacteraceae bacterium]